MSVKQFGMYWPTSSSYRIATETVKAIMKTWKLTEAALAQRLRTSQPSVHRTIYNETRNERLQRAICQLLRRITKGEYTLDDLLIVEPNCQDELAHTVPLILNPEVQEEAIQ